MKLIIAPKKDTNWNTLDFLNISLCTFYLDVLLYSKHIFVLVSYYLGFLGAELEIVPVIPQLSLQALS